MTLTWSVPYWKASPILCCALSFLLLLMMSLRLKKRLPQLLRGARHGAEVNLFPMRSFGAILACDGERHLDATRASGHGTPRLGHTKAGV